MVDEKSFGTPSTLTLHNYYKDIPTTPEIIKKSSEPWYSKFENNKRHKSHGKFRNNRKTKR